MRKAITVVFILFGVVLIGVFGVLLYAYFNLNSIIADNQGRVLAALSNALGRDVQAGAIRASLGWGVSADVSDLKVADDPAISQQPFIQADTVSAKLNLMPLLSKHLDITEVVLEKPIIHIVQASDGQLNVSTIGKKHEEHVAPPKPSPEQGGGPAGGTPLEAQTPSQKPGLPSVYVKNFSVEDGELVFEQAATGTKMVVNSINLQLRNFAFDQAFEIDLTMAALGDTQNIKVTANVGPVMQSGALDVNAIPISAKVALGPLAFSSVKSIPMIAKSIPPKLDITQPLSAQASTVGTVSSINFTGSIDLTSNQITFGDNFMKAAGLPLKVSGAGTRNGSDLAVTLAEVNIGEIDAKATNIKLGAVPSAQIDTNNFDLAPLGKMVPAIAKYDLSGKSELHVVGAFAEGKPSAKGTVALNGVGLSIPGQKVPPLGGLTGTIRLDGNSAGVGPLNFNLGASHATLISQVESIQPVKASYQLNADAIHLADLVPSRPQDEQINQLATNGKVSIGDDGPNVSAHVTSTSGNVNKIAYQNLALDGSLVGKAAKISSLKVDAFSGALAAAADTQLAPRAPFNAAVNFAKINVQQALQSQDLKAASVVRGLVTGNINVSGTTGTFDQMKPTFRGNGRVSLADGKLIGINVASDGLKKVQNLPGIGSLVTPDIVAKHPELFSNPDTDIQSASLTFTLQGPRIITHDLKVTTVDYWMTGDGWFDMDKNINLAAAITLSRSFTQDLMSEKHNIVYVTNNNGEVYIPLQVVGQLPKPKVVPDVTQLVQQAGTRAVETQGQNAINKFLGKKGLGGFFGGGDNSNGGNNGNNGGNNNPPNPLNQLKNLF